MGWKSCGVVRFDLGPIHRGQTGLPILKVLITHLLLVLEVWDGKQTYRKSWAGNLVVWSWAPPSRSNDGSLALVSCLSGGYKFASVL